MKLSPQMLAADLNAAERDIVCLDMICQNINDFILHSHGENRSAFKVDLFKYETLAKQARELRQRILDYQKL